MPKYNIESRVKLNDGNEYPRFGLGVYDSAPGTETYQAVKWALEAGYRGIDTAEWYENEADTGRAIRDFLKESGVPRSEIFYTTKLMHNKGKAWTHKSIEDSYKKSGLVPDLYLIHGPQGGPDMRAELWEALCEAKDEGKVKSIGVSNFGVKHLQDLLARKPKYVPAVNQVDLHPFMTRHDIVEFCQLNGIVLEAWAPLVRGLRFDHPVIKQMAAKHGKTPAQVLVRYGLDRGFIVIPKSIKKNRIEENAQVFDFELNEADLDEMNKLDCFLITDWEVTTEP